MQTQSERWYKLMLYKTEHLSCKGELSTVNFLTLGVWRLERQRDCCLSPTTIYHTNITKKSVNSFCSNKFIMTSRLPLTKKPQVLIFYYSTVLLYRVVHVGKVMWEFETLHVYTTVYYVNNVLSEINKLSSYQLDWDRQTQQCGQQRQSLFARTIVTTTKWAVLFEQEISCSCQRCEVRWACKSNSTNCPPGQALPAVLSPHLLSSHNQ